MSEDLAEHVEILVHSAAPTSKKEDDRIRAQALAILGFIPEKRMHITSLTFPKKRVRQDEEGRRGSQKLRSSRAKKDYDEENQLEEISQNTRLTSRDSEAPLEHSTESSADKPRMMPGLLPQPIDSGISPMVPVISNQTLSSPAESQQLPALDEYKPDSSYATSRFDSWESPPASIPDSQPVYDTYVPPIDQFPLDTKESDDKATPPEVSGVSFCYNHAPPSAGSLPPLPPRLESQLLSDCSLNSLHSTYPLPSARLPEYNSKAPLKTLIGEPYELISPAPETGSNPPLITCQLQEMTAVGDGKLLVGKYQKLKKSQVRELRKWERGHWKIDMSSWESPKKKVNFWNILKDNVENGRLGLVNVFLDDDVGDIVKVYCHGGMVEHLWCALFVMSSRNLKSATWIDAGDNETIAF